LDAEEYPTIFIFKSEKPKRARLTAERHGIKFWYSDYQKLLERSDIDVAVVATPHPTHAEIAINAIEAGKHVIIQKPHIKLPSDSLKSFRYF